MLIYNYSVRIEQDSISAKFQIEEPYLMLNYLLELEINYLKNISEQLKELKKGGKETLINWGHEHCLITSGTNSSIIHYIDYDQKGEVAEKTTEIATFQLRRLLEDWIKLSEKS